MIPTFVPFFTELKMPQLYETDVFPISVYGSTLTEVFRVEIGEDEEKKANIIVAWENFVESIRAVKSLSGVSINMETKTFLGIIGWDSEEVFEYTSGSLG
jgi:hypothetical protein